MIVHMPFESQDEEVCAVQQLPVSTFRGQQQLGNFTRDITGGQKVSYLLLKLLAGVLKSLCKSLITQLSCCRRARLAYLPPPPVCIISIDIRRI